MVKNHMCGLIRKMQSRVGGGRISTAPEYAHPLNPRHPNPSGSLCQLDALFTHRLQRGGHLPLSPSPHIPGQLDPGLPFPTLPLLHGGAFPSLLGSRAHISGSKQSRSLDLRPSRRRRAGARHCPCPERCQGGRRELAGSKAETFWLPKNERGCFVAALCSCFPTPTPTPFSSSPPPNGWLLLLLHAGCS